jgi:hypothetical protein
MEDKSCLTNPTAQIPLSQYKLWGQTKQNDDYIPGRRETICTVRANARIYTFTLIHPKIAGKIFEIAKKKTSILFSRN